MARILIEKNGEQKSVDDSEYWDTYQKQGWRILTKSTPLLTTPMVEKGRIPIKESWQMTKKEFVKTPQTNLLVHYPPSGKDVIIETRIVSEWDEKKGKAIEFLVFVEKGKAEPLSPEYIHKILVQKALSEGKTVPPEVLKDYPELQKLGTTSTIPPELEPLTQEARKYKSAEEFVTHLTYLDNQINTINKGCKIFILDINGITHTGNFVKIGEGIFNKKRKSEPLIQFEMPHLFGEPIGTIRLADIKKISGLKIDIPLQLTDFYNQAVKGAKEIKPEVEVIKTIRPGKLMMQVVSSVFGEETPIVKKVIDGKIRVEIKDEKELEKLNEFWKQKFGATARLFNKEGFLEYKPIESWQATIESKEPTILPYREKLEAPREKKEKPKYVEPEPYQTQIKGGHQTTLSLILGLGVGVFFLSLFKKKIEEMKVR